MKKNIMKTLKELPQEQAEYFAKLGDPRFYESHLIDLMTQYWVEVTTHNNDGSIHVIIKADGFQIEQLLPLPLEPDRLHKSILSMSSSLLRRIKEKEYELR